MSTSSKRHAFRILHAMFRVGDIEESIRFYTELMGMRVLRRKDYDSGEFTLVFLGYDDEDSATVLELTYNWDGRTYEAGTSFGHIALAVDDIYEMCANLSKNRIRITREPGPMQFDPNEIIAFIEDPDGNQIELIQCPV